MNRARAVAYRISNQSRSDVLVPLKCSIEGCDSITDLKSYKSAEKESVLLCQSHRGESKALEGNLDYKFVPCCNAKACGFSNRFFKDHKNSCTFVLLRCENEGYSFQERPIDEADSSSSTPKMRTSSLTYSRECKRWLKRCLICENQILLEKFQEHFQKCKEFSLQNDSRDTKEFTPNSYFEDVQEDLSNKQKSIHKTLSEIQLKMNSCDFTKKFEKIFENYEEKSNDFISKANLRFRQKFVIHNGVWRAEYPCLKAEKINKATPMIARSIFELVPFVKYSLEVDDVTKILLGLCVLDRDQDRESNLFPETKDCHAIALNPKNQKEKSKSIVSLSVSLQDTQADLIVEGMDLVSSSLALKSEVVEKPMFLYIVFREETEVRIL